MEHGSGTNLELPVELIEELRAQLHETVDRRIDALLAGQASQEADLALPLDIHTSVFKGKRPLSVSFSNGRTVETLTWKKVASAVLSDCNSDPVRHERLMSAAGKVLGRGRVLLGDKRGMDSPIRIDEGLYMETRFDTESLLYVLKERILKPVGYDCEGIHIQCRPPEQTMSDQQQGSGPTMTGQSM